VGPYTRHHHLAGGRTEKSRAIRNKRATRLERASETTGEKHEQNVQPKKKKKNGLERRPSRETSAIDHDGPTGGQH